VRAVLGILVLAITAWLALALLAPKGTSVPAQAFSSSRECQDCHTEIYAEWEESQHAMSWTNPAVRLLSNDFANQDCIDCHAPQPVFVTGIGNRVKPRTLRRAEGVDCISCHQLPANADGTPGGMAGGMNDERAACRPTERRELARPDHCAGCHNQHKTVDQWRESSWFDGVDKQDCSDCHMPIVEGPNGSHRSHLFPGGDTLSMLQRAVTFEGGAQGGAWQVTISNTGGGHAFPTDERSRAADIFWRILGDNDTVGPWRHLHRMRSPYRTEVDVEDTLLQADEVRVLPVTSEPEGVGDPIAADLAIEVALFYKRSPYWIDAAAPDPDAEATLVYALELRP